MSTYREGIKKQKTPIKIPELSNIKSLAAGGNHMLALDKSGNVWSWGDASQYQLGRVVTEKYRHNALKPTMQTGLHRNDTTYIAAGGYHSFAVDEQDRVWAWGLNNYGQTGVLRNAGEDNAVIVRPSLVRSLYGTTIVDIQGGLHHSVACSDEGELFSWGRCDDGQAGVPRKDLPEEDVVGGSILLKPVTIPGKLSYPDIRLMRLIMSGITAQRVAVGIDNSFAIDADGKVYSWGFSLNYRTGQGTEETIDGATRIENTAVKDRVLSFAGCGGQFSVLASPAEEA